MQVAAGADALDDLLAEVTAFAEVEGAGRCAEGSGFLGQVLVANVGAEEGCAFRNAELVKGFGVGAGCAAREERGGEGGDGRGVGPELKAGDERAVRVDEGDRAGELGEGEGCGGGVEVDGGEDGGGVRPGEEQAGLAVQGLELDVVHDDEVLEVGEESGELVAAGLEEDRVRLEEGGGVGLDAALRVEEEGVAALARGERLDGVCGHAVEPANAVVSGDAKPGRVVQGDQGCGGDERRDGIDSGGSFGGLGHCGGAHRRKHAEHLRTLAL